MFTTALPSRHTERTDVTIRPGDGVVTVIVEPKGAAVSLRQQLVRRGIACTFPVPTWERGMFEFHAKRPEGVSQVQLEELIGSLTEDDRISGLSKMSDN